ncbi:MATE family efflux transporter [Cetobacterium sp. 2G large]|uniref:MATE family efflux transporter n=1 Tax=Cetobacterium sp. 2G large TaxID=2759680 RepID=UPI00163CCA46|nr:MATE family efflux transporter [Cetobacterium sp. 2G large]MBC2852489.1 MATE family efflux transporter [Cetobacterium sp. 2G large]
MKMTINKHTILTGNIYKLIFILATPLLFSNILNRIYDLTDAFFLGKIGGIQVAAITYSWPLINLIFSLSHGLGVAGTSLISISIGKGIQEEIDANVQQFLNMGIILSIFIGTFCYFFTKEILIVLGTQGELLEECKKYMEIIFLATPFTFIITCYSALRKAEGKNLKASTILSLSVISNMIFTPIFIFNFNAGISGAAWGTFLAKFIGAIYCIYDCLYSKNSLNYKFSKSFFSLKKTLEFLKVGFPASLSEATTSLGFVILNSYVRDYGTIVLAAYGIGNKVNSIFFIPVSVVATSLTTLIGQSYGANDVNRMKDVLNKAIKLGIIISTIGALGIFFLSKNIALIFTKDPSILKHSIVFMKIISISLLGWGVSQIYNGFFIGIKKTQLTLFISIFRLWGVRLPLFIILSKFNINEYAVWYAMCLSNLSVGIFSYFIFKKNSSIFKKNADSVPITI